MTITPITASSTQRVDNDGDDKNSGRASFAALGKALQSGDLASAQAAFAKLQASAPKNAPQTPSSTSTSSTNPLTDLASALKSGDLAGAQKAFSALQSSNKSKGHHHRGIPSGGGTGIPTMASLGVTAQNDTTSQTGTSAVLAMASPTSDVQTASLSTGTLNITA